MPQWELAPGAVCEPCNNTLGSELDRVLAEDLDVLRFWAGVRGKRGKPAQVRSRGNVVGFTNDDGRHMHINMERHAVDAEDGTRLSPAGRSSRAIDATFERHGPFGQTHFEVEFGRDPRFARALVKIALSALALKRGTELVLQARFDPVREFVREGRGDRRVVIYAAADAPGYLNTIDEPREPARGDYVMAFRLTAFHALVDLTPDMRLLELLAAEARNANPQSYTILPFTKPAPRDVASTRAPGAAS